MDRYVVKGLREGQAAAIQEEREAPNVRTVAALDAFGNPGAAVGEMLQRLAGVAVDGAGGRGARGRERAACQDRQPLAEPADR